MNNTPSFNVSAVYDIISKDYDALFNKPSIHINDFLNIISPKGKILDAGCGSGVDSAYINSLGFSVIGVDLSDEMLSLAKQKTSNVEFIKKDFTELDFNDNYSQI